MTTENPAIPTSPPGCRACDCDEVYDGPSANALCKCGHVVSAHDEITPLNFLDIREELDNALIAVSNLLERSWSAARENKDSAGIIIGHYRVCWYTFKAMRYLMSTSRDGFRLQEFVTAGAPLARSILDALANIIYLFQDDLDQRVSEFIARGFHEDQKRAAQHKAHYGDNPAWNDYLEELAGEEDRVRTLLSMSHAEVAKLSRFPTIGGMASEKSADRIADDERRKFLLYLQEWFYKEFSQEAHLSAPGLYRRARPLFVESRLWTDEHRKDIDNIRGGTLMSAIALMLAVASELEAELDLGVRARFVALWTRLAHHSMMIADLYRRRYAKLLATGLAAT